MYRSSQQREYTMTKISNVYDSHAWTGEEDYVEVEVLSFVILFGSVAMLLAGMMA